MLRKLPNGLTSIIVEQRSAPVVTIQMWVGVGAADETPRQHGLAHMHEHMIFKGTERRGVGEIARDVEACGGEINAWTSFDETVYYVVMPSRHFERGLDVIADALTGAIFDPEELARETEVILEELRRSQDSPSSQLSELLFSTAWRKHPYRRPILGTERALRKYRREAVWDFYQQHYRPENMTLVVVGDVDEGAAAEAITQALGRFERNGAPHAPSKRTKEPAQREPRAAVIHADVQESYIEAGWHIPELLHPDIPALDLLSVVLGQGESSRFSERLRHGRAIVSDAWGYAYTPKEPGIFISGATTEPGKARRALDALLRETSGVARDGVTEEELDKARLVIEAEHIQQRQTVQGQARKLGFYHVTAGGLEQERRYLDAIARVEAEDLRRVTETWLRPEQVTAVVLEPEKRGRSALNAEVVRKVVQGASDALARRRPKARAAKPKRSGPRIERFSLPSGTQVLVQEDRSVPFVSTRALFLGGTRFENAGNHGINHLLSRIVTRGSAGRAGDVIAREVEAMAAHLTAYSGRNSFGYSLESLSRHFERGLDILFDAVLAPDMPEDEVVRERQLVLQDLLAREDNLGASCFDLFHRTFYAKHPYRLPVMGRRENIEAFTPDALRRYHKKWFRPSAMTVAVVGDVKVADVRRRLEARLGSRPSASPKPPRIPEEPALSSSRHGVLHRAREQTHLVVGATGVTMAHRDRAALQVLCGVLTGQGGRLFLELRDRRSLAYSVSAFTYDGLDNGYFAVYIATAPSKRDEAISGIREELSRLVRDGVSDEELDRARTWLAGTHEVSLQRAGARAAAYGFHELYGMGWEETWRAPERILGVTQKDLRRVARRYLDPARCEFVIAEISPES